MLLLTLMVLGTTAQAQFDPLFGDGHSGTLTVTQRTTVNLSLALSADVQPGAATLEVVSSLGLAPGDLVLLHQHSALLASDAGDQRRLDLRSTGAGQVEWLRVATVRGTTLDLVTPATRAFPAALSQVVKVPEYTEVTIADGGSLVAAPWDGNAGGLVVVVCTGRFVNHGLVSATAAGFRGGVASGATSTSCSMNDPLGTGRGESVDRGRFGERGAGNVANGGGGICPPHTAGAGGALVGRGGSGEGIPGPVGGVSISRGELEPLLFGGGGGGSINQVGNRGGGVVLIRATQLFGPGRFEADGESGERTFSQGTAGSGGGAGGTLHLRTRTRLECASASASGGGGGVGGWGDPTRNTGQAWAGGGGGGGLVLLQSSDLACAGGALAGRSESGRGYLLPGAEFESASDPAGIGLVRLERSGFDAPAPPRIDRPRMGEVVQPRTRVEGVAPSGDSVILSAGSRAMATFVVTDGGHFAGELIGLEVGPAVLTARASAVGTLSGPSVPVVVSVAEPPDAGAEADAGADAPDAGDRGGLLPVVSSVAQCQRPWEFTPATLSSGRFSLEPLAEPLPEGLEVDETSGVVRWTPPSSAKSTRFVLAQTSGANTDRLAVSVTVVCQAQVGCGCGATADLSWLVLALLARRRRLVA